MNSDNTQPRLLRFNTLFDLSLSGEDASRHADGAAALSVGALLCCESTDAALLDAQVDQDCLDWLSVHGFFPNVAMPDQQYASFIPVPWGWDRESEDLFVSLGCVFEHPASGAVRRANSRELSNRVAEEAGSPSAGRTANSRGGLAALLDPEQFPCVVKPCHGSAGSGFALVSDEASAARAVDRSEKYFSRAHCVSVERWLDRVDDYSANFIVKKEGLESFTCHRAYIDRRGIFRGIDICDDVPAAYAKQLRETALIASRELLAAGYTGPAGIDAFTFRDAERVLFNPVCEINARLTMGEVARSLHRVLGGRCGRMLPVVTGGADIPHEMEKFSQLFGSDAYTPASKRGIFPATPVNLVRGGKPLTAKRVLVYIAGESHEECDNLESRMREIFSALRPARRAE
jgi:hypothetical protein